MHGQTQIKSAWNFSNVSSQQAEIWNKNLPTMNQEW